MPHPLEWNLISGADVPDPQPSSTAELVSSVQTGDFAHILKAPFTQSLVTPQSPPTEVFDFLKSLRERIDVVIGNGKEAGYEKKLEFILVGIAALNAFIQSNVTGPPLTFRPEEILLPRALRRSERKDVSDKVIRELAVEGEAAYHLIPHALLFALAKGILSHPVLDTGEEVESMRWWRLRMNFLHQRMLEGEKTALHDVVYKDVDYLVAKLQRGDFAPGMKWVQARFLIEKAQVDTYFGYEKAAREGLERAARVTGLQYAITGVLGKRTKYQERDISQLVVLARSKEDFVKSGVKNGGEKNGSGEVEVEVAGGTKPKTLDLNDDTLLETISFTKKENMSSTAVIVDDETKLPEVLRKLDPGEQPPLHPLDSTILLLLTETIKNNNPATGITREQMAPYAERVLKHSTNWEVYTIGLLVRCRIEGYKSRTAERGLLQLQALVDQVIAETTLPSENGSAPKTFLPRPKTEEESAPVRERLEYVYQLPAPTRWELEAELANRWVSIGGLKTALEIYERLEMWAEVALCYAAIGKEDKARKIVRNQLLHPVPTPASWTPESEDDEYKPTQMEEAARLQIYPQPNNAPRLWSILGDIDNDPVWYEMAWEVSNHRYARAKRSLGRYWYNQKEPLKAAEAYTASLNINQLNKESWFLLGCCRLELEDWEGGEYAFRKVTVLDEEDAEAWSNLASCLLRRASAPVTSTSTRELLDDEEELVDSSLTGENDEWTDVKRNRQDALKALKKASSLKYDNWRIWENTLIVAASIPAYTDVALAMNRVISIRAPTAGESCIDVEILSRLIQHVLTSCNPEDLIEPRSTLSKLTITLMEDQVLPLITKDARLWRLMARLALWRKRPKEALECHERAFRCISRGWEVGEVKWEEVMEATVEMVDAYQGLGEMEREGLANTGKEGAEKVMVAKDWRFKARSALRKTMGWGRKEGKEGEGAWDRLEEAQEGLKA
ncbi:TPR-like protein [Terfezia boudieri ATCC MYA-4762]|uniref:TPR-like protein n=1 Tax=Terfezia boudieri ATCC MYA-4762 TaxID=1051890 RepID=A0A3N4LMR6_9PEZI|nr:TPR-like protein [Terfezia boudieri ATCC MYA-4762]